MRFGRPFRLHQGIGHDCRRNRIQTNQAPSNRGKGCQLEFGYNLQGHARDPSPPGEVVSVKIFMRRSCNTSSIHQGARGNALESGASEAPGRSRSSPRYLLIWQRAIENFAN